jgi:hypothetical protein
MVMTKWAERLAHAALLVALVSGIASAQDNRARVQGTVMDETKGVMPGVTVTLINGGTGVTADRVTDEKGRYLFDFVDPGDYSVTAELDGFKKADQRNVRVSQRGDVSVDLTLVIGGLQETVTVEAPPVVVQFNSSSSDITMPRQLIDQAPIAGRNPYNLANLDPTVVGTTGTSAAENRPYHHAYANDYDAGGGTNRANDVLLDGVALGASYKTAYTPAVDAVEEITVSKNSVDAENGHSLGGIISLNMKSGTNQYRGVGLRLLPRPQHELRRGSDHQTDAGPGYQESPRHEAHDGGCNAGRPHQEEQALLVLLLRAVGRQAPGFSRPHRAHGSRARRQLQPVDPERRGPHDLQPLVVGHRSGHQPRRPHAVCRQPDPQRDVRSRRPEDAAGHSAAQPSRERRQPAAERVRQDGLLELLPAH